MIEIPVELPGRRYALRIGRGAAAALPGLVRGRRVALVASRRVWTLYGRSRGRGLPRPAHLLPDGERHKTLTSVARLHDAFLQAGLARDGVVVAFGGGVTGDVAGFAAATYMRGIDWVGVPTTLVAMVDSSIGGKVGVNHARAKNLVGAFHQPRAVVIDPVFLETLPRRQLRSGAYEILKCGLIGDRPLFEQLAAAPPGLRGWEPMELERAVAASCRLKVSVVERDERERGLRRVLNLGHSVGHALEAVTRYRRFTHGEAVGWGLIAAAWIARERGLVSQRSYAAIAAGVDRIGPRPPVADLPVPAIVEALRHDKKVKAGRLVFVLPVGIGRVTVREDVEPGEVRGALRALAGHERGRP